MTSTYQATKMDKTNFYYDCKYPNSICPKKEHFHGTMRTYKNRVEDRISHCLGDCKNNIHYTEIIIDDNTKRINI